MKPVLDQNLSIYLHIPFCTTKCTYCSFNTYVNIEALIPNFVEALIQEIKIIGASNIYHTVHTIYFGGGTPSLLTIDQFDAILAAITQSFSVLNEAEISIEANPNDLSVNYLKELRRLGINRLSIGMQSAIDQELNLFARRHDNQTVVTAVQQARDAGFNNINLDLIYGFPYQTLTTWEKSLEQVLSFSPEHISLYALGLEEGTPLKSWVEKGKLPLPDDDLAADMYEFATEVLRQTYLQYEISNWAKSGFECLHNLQYWRNAPYIGLGPGAHGYANGIRYSTILSPQQYIQLLKNANEPKLQFPITPAVHDYTLVDQSTEIAETLITNLRLLHEGVHLSDFEHRFGVSLMQLHGNLLKKFEKQGLLQITKDRVLLTEQGRLLSNVIFRELV
ncbi:MAG: radical SAM family heme chaperone HemW [Phototrophicales bacterium]